MKRERERKNQKSNNSWNFRSIEDTTEKKQLLHKLRKWIVFMCFTYVCAVDDAVYINEEDFIPEIAFFSLLDGRCWEGKNTK
jgi:hypothetical protein